MPMLLDEVLGHDNTKSYLRDLEITRKFPKAFQVYGPSGVGKCMTMINWASDVSLDSRSDLRALALSGDHPDVMLFKPSDCYDEKALSSRKSKPTWKTEFVKSKLEEIMLTPVFGPWRFVIFDDFDHLSSSRDRICDAFLKILEDGVDKTTFVLVSEEIEDFPLTLRARCLPLEFRGLSLEQAAKVVGRDIDPTLFDLSMGSLSKIREYQSLEPLSFSDLKAKVDTIFKSLDSLPTGKLFQFVSSLPDTHLKPFFDLMLAKVDHLLRFPLLANPTPLDHQLHRKYEKNLPQIYEIMLKYRPNLDIVGVQVSYHVQAVLLEMKRLL